jgi:hypothetical protein
MIPKYCNLNLKTNQRNYRQSRETIPLSMV